MRSHSLFALAFAATLLDCSTPDTSGVPKAQETPETTPLAVAKVTEVNPRLLRRFQSIETPAPPSSPTAAAKLALGRQLFFDPRLSMDQDLSCNGCHALDRYGMDGSATSKGRSGAHGTRNAPTVFNAAGHFAQFWDGRAQTVEEQAKGPISNPIEMGLPADQAVARLKAVDEYVNEFAKAYPGDADPVTIDHVGDAIGAFERTLVLRSRWDVYLEGDRTALSAAEKEGLRVFLNSGCMVCHTGKYVGGSMFERLGAVEPWPNSSDVGRMAVTGSPADRMMFKVPSLRNVEKTAPYFHDGSAKTLDQAVQMMGRHQLGIDLAPEEIQSIVTWLRSLTADLPHDLTARPRLPGEKA
jgi:cytochrome c peroxidase